ncbi:hypothetical protein XELAEV_18044945mg [Xenopus laevis]|uniref:Uncharacterized protein n=1 Tax=Xenopus laevis TaxID=8355 RepID=A0A974C026_XENLA|nr:hypothetical protein XELAEV_18044945mg [Xenopus laevis]
MYGTTFIQIKIKVLRRDAVTSNVLICYYSHKFIRVTLLLLIPPVSAVSPLILKSSWMQVIWPWHIYTYIM